MKKVLFLILACSVLGTSTWAQEATEATPQWAIQANVQHQDLVIQAPIGLLGVTHKVWLRPMYSLEAQRLFVKSERTTQYLSMQVGYYHNTYHSNWWWAKIGWGVERRFFKRWIGSLRIEGGVGQMQDADIQYQHIDGVWEPIRANSGRKMAVLITPRLDIGYRIKEGKQPLDVFVKADGTLIFNRRNLGSPYYGLGFGLRMGL